MLQSVAREYFASSNFLNHRILTDIATVEKAYDEKWEGMQEKEKEKVVIQINCFLFVLVFVFVLECKSKKKKKVLHQIKLIFWYSQRRQSLTKLDKRRGI